MKKQAANLIVHSVGGAFIVAGIGAGFVPLVPGFVLIIIGLYIMSLRSSWLRGRIVWARAKFPKLHNRMTAFEDRARNLKKKIFFWS